MNKNIFKKRTKNIDASKIYMVSLFIKTPFENLEKISKYLDIRCDKRSWNKGEKIFKRVKSRNAKQTVWIFNTDRKKSFEKQMEEIVSVFESSFFSKGGKFPENWEVLLSIGIMYKTFTCSIIIEDRYLKWLGDKKVKLEVSSYPA